MALGQRARRPAMLVFSLKWVKLRVMGGIDPVEVSWAARMMAGMRVEPLGPKNVQFFSQKVPKCPKCPRRSFKSPFPERSGNLSQA